MQNTCNLANCTLHSADLISGAAVEWSDFSVVISAVGWFWQGKWTSAWGLAEVRKTSHCTKICHWTLIAARVANYKPELPGEARQSLGMRLFVWVSMHIVCIQTSHCGLLHLWLRVIDITYPLSSIKNAKWICRVVFGIPTKRTEMRR